MNNIIDLIKEKRLFFDGGMGTMLQKRGLATYELPELWNIEHPEIIEDVHRHYLTVGANIITTNTFGVNPLKHNNYKELICAAIKCAKNARLGFSDSFIAFDIGPLGKFLEPIGDLPFEKAVELFAQCIRVARDEGVDLILIETMTDSYETKAAVLAAKENCNLPVFVTNVYDQHGKTLTGSSPEAMVAMLEGLKVDAIGINCSLGPDKMIPLVERIYKVSSLPVICSPNAGIPTVTNGKTKYAFTPKSFAEYAVRLAQSGANILGGCCGTEPEHIKLTVEATHNIPLNLCNKKLSAVASSYTHTVVIEKHPLLIGERLNPTGKPKLKQALKDGNMDYILEQAIKQAERGVHILDVNVGLPELDESKTLVDSVLAVQALCDLPLQLDSNNPQALEKAMRIYNGKPIINSVCGDDESLDAIFPLISKYGGLVVALTLDKNGIPASSQKRVEIARHIISKAKQYGIDEGDLIFDPLALSVATDPENDRITLETVKALNDLGLNTTLGISNVSFGMPERERINASFFGRALLNGLKCAIMNPNSNSMMSVYSYYIDLLASKISLKDYNDAISDINYQVQLSSLSNNTELEARSLKDAILRGLLNPSREITADMLLKNEPLDIINLEIIPALNKAGEAFEAQKIYLPQLLSCAECAAQSFSLIKDALPISRINGNCIILATVKGDVHDIGKNIVKLLLESYGYRVIDLGKNVEPEVILDSAIKHSCQLVALSALMTTTLPSMKETIELLKSYNCQIKVMVGGAVLTEEYAKGIGADYYGKDALSAVRIAQEFYK